MESVWNFPIHIISIVIQIYVLILLLRIWLRLAHTDYYNPICQYVVKVTSPILNPLRTFIPSKSNFDIAALVVAFILSLLRIYISVHFVWPNTYFMILFSIADLVKLTLTLVYWVLIIYVISTWLARTYNPVSLLLYQLTNPLLHQIRRIIPTIAGLDFSAIVLFLILGFITSQVDRLVYFLM